MPAPLQALGLDQSLSVSDRIDLDLVALIKNLELKALPITLANGAVMGDIGDNVYARGISADTTDMNFPAVEINSDGLREEEGESNFEEDVVIYRKRILIADHASVLEAASYSAQYLMWRETIMRTLRGLVARPLLPDVPELQDVRLEPESVFDAQQQGGKFMWLISGFVAKFTTNQPRLRNG